MASIEQPERAAAEKTEKELLLQYIDSTSRASEAMDQLYYKGNQIYIAASSVGLDTNQQQQVSQYSLQQHSNNKASTGTKSKITCNYCNRTRHSEAKCWVKKRDQATASNASAAIFTMTNAVPMNNAESSDCFVVQNSNLCKS